MKVSEFRDKTVLILGLGQEGRSAWRCLRAAYPKKVLGLADQLPLEQLSSEIREGLRQDARLKLHLGPGYLSSLTRYDVIVKSPGIPVVLPEYQRAAQAGKTITSPTAIFFANFAGTVIGVTGTKGKSTTASLLHAILERKYRDLHLVGNIGAPALDLLPRTGPDTRVVFELSSHQLEGLGQSPHIAVLLNVVPEHLDYYESFEQYMEAKTNITRFQSEQDFLVFDADHEVPRRMALISTACRVSYSIKVPQLAGCFLYGEWLMFQTPLGGAERVMPVTDVPLLGKFNLGNVAAALAVGKILGIANEQMAEAVRLFQPLEHRLERVGTYGGITYYNDSIATVPEATMAALEALGPDVETILLGGTDRRLDFSGLAKSLVESNVRTLLLFPATGERIWQAIQQHDAAAGSRLRHFFVETMEAAVALAQQHTAPGMICLLSPASASFGLFRDYRERGERFKQLAREDKQ